MSTLYTFGCSYTQDFEDINPHLHNGLKPAQLRYVDEFLNGVIPPTWSKVLSNLLGYDRINMAQGGSGNENIFENVCVMSPQFKKGDMVIIQWTENHRFRWPNSEGNWVQQLPGWKIDIPTLSKSTYEEIIVIRDHSLYRKQLYNYHILIEQLALSVGFDIYYWSMGNNIITELPKDKKFLLSDKLDNSNYLNNNYNKYFRIMNGYTVTEETNGLISDGHYSKTGHEVIGRLFYEHITS
jgi:hypothetical protein